MSLKICEFLEWDSRFFGINIARVRDDILTPEKIKTIELWCDKHHIRCLYFLSSVGDSQTINIAEKFGFHLADIRIMMSRSLSDNTNISDDRNNLSIREAKPEDMEELQHISSNMFRDSRFYFDKNFSKDQCEALYHVWIKNSIEGYADVVFVAQISEKIIGFITLAADGDNSRKASVGLIGVHDSMKGYGIGKVLIHKGLEWGISQDILEIMVNTQGRNIAAQRLYQRCGFLTRDVKAFYHKWF